jgi:hypothetical protein
MGRAKPHVGGGTGAQEPIIQHKRNHSKDGAGAGRVGVLLE